MRNQSLIFLLCVAWLIGPGNLIGQSPSKFIEPNTTTILFAANDKDQKLVTTLRKEDIRVSEDGVPQQITRFESQVDIPISLSILVDVSISQERFIPMSKPALLSFINSLLASGKNRAAVVSFAGKAALKQDLTANSGEVQAAIQSLAFVPPPPLVKNRPATKDEILLVASAVWDTLWLTCDRIFPQPAAKSKQVIVIISDGSDTASKKEIGDAINRANRSAVAIYSVGVGDKKKFNLEKGLLNKVSEETGGRAFFPQTGNDLEAAFNAIEQELHSQYAVTYIPLTNKSNNGYRKLRIEIIDPEKKKEKLKLIYQNRHFLGG